MTTVGVPTEIKADEKRIAITVSGVHELAARGIDVLVQSGAGDGSAMHDDEFRAAGATIVPDSDTAWSADIVAKVKETLGLG